MALAQAALLAAASCAARNGPAKRWTLDAFSRETTPAPPEHEAPWEYESLAASDPLAFLRMCKEKCERDVRDYRCRLKQVERRGRTLSPEQEIEARCREEPFSVDLRWIRNPHLARRVTYIEGRWIRRGRPMLRVEPAGWLRWVASPVVFHPIDGPYAKSSARHRIDRFGFRRMLESCFRGADRARSDPGSFWRYRGRGILEGRPTYVFERRISPEGGRGEEKARLLIMHIDRDLLIPTGFFSYLDDEGTELLGAYVFTDIELNIGLTDADFPDA